MLPERDRPRGIGEVEDVQPAFHHPPQRLARRGQDRVRRPGPVEQVAGDQHRMHAVPRGELGDRTERVQHRCLPARGEVAEAGERRTEVDVGQVQQTRHFAERVGARSRVGGPGGRPRSRRRRGNLAGSADSGQLTADSI